MKRAAVLAVLLLAASTSLSAQSAKRYLVATRGDAFEQARSIVAGELHPGLYRDVVPFESVDAFAVNLTEEEVSQLQKSPRVLFIEEDVPMWALADSVVSGSETIPYGVSMINAPGIWPVTKGNGFDGTKINVVVVDTGVAFGMSELAAAYRGGYNTFNASAGLPPLDDNGHGTHVAGTIAAAQNGAGVTGAAPHINLWAIKVLTSCGSGSLGNLVPAIDWVIARKRELGGNWIMSLSLGSTGIPAAVTTAFQRAESEGILTFAASGNSYDENPVEGISYPAALPTVVAVGAIDSEKKVAEFSQRGVELDLVAPGVEVLSTTVSQEVKTTDGRTFAAALPVTADGVCLTVPTVNNAQFVDCGVGNTTDFPASVFGKVALVQRGGTSTATGQTLTFTEKATNARKAGALLTVVYNNVDTPVTPNMSTVTSTNTVTPLMVISKVDGASLKATPETRLSFSFGFEGYGLSNGTSMSTPHVSAAAALVWAVAPTATAAQVKSALITTAQDIGPSGFDNTYGFGLVDALAAAKTLAPARFSGEPQPPATSFRRVLRRR